MFGVILSLFMMIGDTSRAPLYRVGISLEEHISRVVNVYESGRFRIYIPFSTRPGMKSAVNPMPNRLYVVTNDSGIYYTMDFLSGEWQVEDNFRKFLLSSKRFNSTKGIKFIVKTPITKSIWYVFGDYGIVKNEGRNLSVNKMKLYCPSLKVRAMVPIQGVDTEVIAISADSIYHITLISDSTGDTFNIEALGEISGLKDLYATSAEVLAYGDSGIFKVFPSFSTQPVCAIRTNSIVGISSGLYAATADGIMQSSDGGTTWNQLTFAGREITAVGSNADSLFVVVSRDSVVYYSVNGHDFNVYGAWPKYFKDIGITNVSQILPVDDSYTVFLTPMGPFVLSDNGEMISRSGTDPEKLFFDNISTELIDTTLPLLETFDSIYLKIENYLSNYGIHLPDTVNLLIYPIFQYTDVENDYIIDYLPFYGYAQVSDSFLTNEVALNVAYSFPLTWKSLFELTQEEVNAILAYNLVKLALLHRLPGEGQPFISGLSAFIAHHAGYDLSKGFVRDTIEYEYDFNHSLLEGSRHHLDALDIKEVDRERLFYFFEYLYETYGSEIINKLLVAPTQYTGYDRISYALDTLPLSTCLKDWAIKNLVGGYSANPSFKIVPSLPPVEGVVVLPYSLYYLNIPPGGVYSLDISNDITEDWHTMLAENDSTIYEVSTYTDMRRKYLRIPQAENSRVIFFTNGTINSYYISMSDDTIPPDTPRFYIVQNSGFVPYIDFYAFANERLYYDAGEVEVTGVPEVKFASSDTTVRFLMTVFDTSLYPVYRLFQYFDMVGDYQVSVEAQDAFGNFVETEAYPVSIFVLSGSGKYVLLNGRLILTIPSTLSPSGIKLISSYSVYDKGLIYTIGASNMRFSDKVNLEFLTPEEWKVVDIYKWCDGEWRYLTTIKTGGGKVDFDTNELGTFKIVKSTMRHDEDSTEEITPALKASPLSRGILNVVASIPKGGNVEFKVIDLSGRIVKKWRDVVQNSEVREYHITLSQPGIYYVVMNLNGKPYIDRVVLIR